MAAVERARGRESTWSAGLRIVTPADVAAAVAAVQGTAARRLNTVDMPVPVESGARPLERPGAVAPLHPDLVELVPGWGGLRRGSLVAAVGARSLLYALIAPAIGRAGWAAIIGMPDVSPTSAYEHGVDLGHLALVPHPGPDWPGVVAALLDGMDLVVVAGVGRVAAGTARSLAARARRHRTVLLTTTAWPGADLTFTAQPPVWEGLAGGYGRLRRQQTTITAQGQGVAAVERRVTVGLPLANPQRPVDLLAQEWHGPRGRSRLAGNAAGQPAGPRVAARGEAHGPRGVRSWAQ